MKTLFTVCIVLLCLNAYSQQGVQRLDLSPYGLTEQILDVKMRLLAGHEDATQITYFDLNFVEQRMQDFMKKKMGMTITDVSKFIKTSSYETFTVTYTQMATIGTTKIPKLYFKYTIFGNKDKNPIIKSLEITGTSIHVINFFVRYWPTTLNIDVSKSKIAYNYLVQDKATIRLNPANAAWSISVENTSIKTLDDYYSQLNKSSSSTVALETAYSIKQKATKDSMAKVIARNIFYRDSLIKVVDSYGILYGQRTDYSPDTAWLKSAIRGFEKNLNDGKRYNKSNIDTLIQSFKELEPNKDKYITGNIILKINQIGVIDDVSIQQGMSTITPDLLNSIKQIALGKKTMPFVLNGKPYPSYKRYSIGFFPNMKRTQYDINEVGEIRNQR